MYNDNEQNKTKQKSLVINSFATLRFCNNTFFLKFFIAFCQTLLCFFKKKNTQKNIIQIFKKNKINKVNLIILLSIQQFYIAVIADAAVCILTFLSLQKMNKNKFFYFFSS